MTGIILNQYQRYSNTHSSKDDIQPVSGKCCWVRRLQKYYREAVWSNKYITQIQLYQIAIAKFAVVGKLLLVISISSKLQFTYNTKTEKHLNTAAQHYIKSQHENITPINTAVTEVSVVTSVFVKYELSYSWNEVCNPTVSFHNWNPS